MKVGLRSRSSGDDEALVARFARQWGVLDGLSVATGTG